MFLCFKRSSHKANMAKVTHEDWEPAICVATGYSRRYQSLVSPALSWGTKQNAVGRDWGSIQVYRIPYRWRSAVLALRQSYETREEAEAAMAAV